MMGRPFFRFSFFPRRFPLLFLLGCAGLTAISAAIWVVLEWRNAVGIDIALEYQVPADYPEEVATKGKGGRDSHIKRPREEYVYWFKSGFENCCNRFICRGSRSKPDLDPYDDQSGPGLKQYGGYEYRADNEGFQECREQIRQLCDQ